MAIIKIDSRVSSYGAVLEREVVVSTTSGAILSTTTIGTDVTWGAAVYAPAFSIVSGRLRIICPHTSMSYSSGIRAYVTSYYA